MGYNVVLTHSAEKDMDDLPPTMRHRVAEVLQVLADDPRGRNSKKLEAKTGYRAKAGDYRLLYLIDDKVRIVTVYKIGPRRDIYRD